MSSLPVCACLNQSVPAADTPRYFSALGKKAGEREKRAKEKKEIISHNFNWFPTALCSLAGMRQIIARQPSAHSYHEMEESFFSPARCLC